MAVESARQIRETAGNRPAATASDVSADGWWSELSEVSDQQFFARWLDRQCATQAGTRAGIILLPGPQGLVAAASWPARRPPAQDVTRIAERAATTNRPVIAWVRRPDGREGLDLLIGLGIQFDGALAAVVGIVIEVAGGIESIDPDAAADRLRQGAGWLEARFARRLSRSAVAQTERAAVALDIVAVASGQGQIARAAARVVNELAIRLRCDRVSLGLTRRGGIKLRALSHTAAFQERSRIVDTIENAMEECLAQAAPVAYPPLAATMTRISVAHRDLAAIGPDAANVASVVLPGPDGPVGVLTFERRGGESQFDADTLQ